MKKTFMPLHFHSFLWAIGLLSLFNSVTASAVTTVFFDIAQNTNLVASGTTSDTISSEGYLFTYTRDKLFTGGIGLTNPIGRAVRIPWPDGLEAQAVTTGPVVTGAKITIKREDGQLFAIDSFTAKLLANTAGAGAAIEIMPKLNGEDGLPDPAMYDATGYYNQNFTYSTPTLFGFDSYTISLYVDFALMRLTVVDASILRPTLAIMKLDPTTIQLSWPIDFDGYALETATNPTAQIWLPLTNNININNNRFTVEASITASNQWYRLKK